MGQGYQQRPPRGGYQPYQGHRHFRGSYHNSTRGIRGAPSYRARGGRHQIRGWPY